MSGKSASGRIRAIDQFRGLALLGMVLINYGMEIETLPEWLKHAPDVGLTFPDLGTPVFLFAIGLTFGLSFSNRQERDGKVAAISHFIRRYLALIGIGAVITAGQTLLGRELDRFDWGVLQAIGGAGLITLSVIQLPPWQRVGMGAGLLALYQFLLDRFWLELVLGSQHGGLPATLSWGAMMILATVFGDLYREESIRRVYSWAALGTLVAGMLVSIWIPISKNRVSASYGLVCLGFSSLTFLIFYRTNYKMDLLAAWGKNPLLLYLISFIATAIFVLPPFPIWHQHAPLWLVGIQALVLVSSLTWLALFWEKKDFRFSM